MKYILALIISSTLVGCVSLNSVSMTSIPKDRSREVAASAERFIVFGFNFDNDYINNLNLELARKCPDGKVQGILTKDEDVNYFLYMFWKKRVTAEGYCVKGA